MSPELLRSPTRRFGIALVCAKVALVPLAFDLGSDWSFTVPKALLSHALAYALAAVILGLLIRYRSMVLVWSPLHVPVLVFLAVNVAATVFAVDPRLGLFGTHARMLGLGTIADWVILYFAVVLLVRSRNEGMAVLAALFAPTAVVAGYELVQAAGRDPLHWAIDSGGRPFSTIGQSTTLGAYLVAVAAGLIVLAATLERLRAWQRLGLTSWSGLLLLGAVATGTRSIILGAAAAIVVIGIVMWTRSATSRRRAITVASAAAAAAAMALVVALTPLGSRVALTLVGGGTSLEVDPSTAGRLDLYHIAAGIFMERPLLGYGPDSFAAGVPTYRPEGSSPIVRQSLATSAHGWIPYIATGSGAIGLIAFLAILVVAFRTLVRVASSPLALCGAGLAVAFLGTGLVTVDDIAVDWLFWLGLALIAQVAATPAQAPRPVHAKGRGKRQPIVRRGGGYAVPLALAAIAGVALLAGYPAWSASRAARASQDLRVVGKAGEAIDAGVAAVAADGGRADYWHGLGLAYVSGQRFREASSAFEHAVSLTPYDVQFVNDEIQSDLLLSGGGDASARARALELSREAVRRDPNNPRAQLLRATTLLAVGDSVSAEPFVRRALALDPGSTNELLYVTAVQVLVANGHADEASAIARDGLSYLPFNTIALRLEFARALAAAGRPLDAIKELDVLIAIQPNLAQARQLRNQITLSIR